MAANTRRPNNITQIDLGILNWNTCRYNIFHWYVGQRKKRKRKFAIHNIIKKVRRWYINLLTYEISSEMWSYATNTDVNEYIKACIKQVYNCILTYFLEETFLAEIEILRQTIVLKLCFNGITQCYVFLLRLG